MIHKIFLQELLMYSWTSYEYANHYYILQLIQHVLHGFVTLSMSYEFFGVITTFLAANAWHLSKAKHSEYFPAFQSPL